MRNATLTIILAVLLSGAVLAAGPAPAGATGSGACTARQAKVHLRAAHRATLRAQRREREARHVLSATRAYGRSYGMATARWVRLARRVGWRWAQFPALMFIVHRESGGDPRAQNPTSTASGLMQFLSSWWAGRWDPMDPRASLYHGRKAWQSNGFSPWAL